MGGVEHQRPRTIPRRSSYRPGGGEVRRTTEASQNHLVRNLLVFAAVTGSSFFLGRAAGVHIENLPAEGAQAVAGIFPEERDYQGRGKYYDTPVEPGVEKQFLTDDFGQGEIPVRSEPNQGPNQVGITLRNYLVEGQEWWGSTYQSNSLVGRTNGPDGETYGLWFMTEAVPLFEMTESGEYVSAGVATDVYIAENFLTTPPEDTQ